MADHSGVETSRVERSAGVLADRGLVTVADGTVTITDEGHDVAETMRENERQLLRRMIAEWHTGEEPGLDELVEELSARLGQSDPSPAGLRS
jgi:DNA-binding MarR family transcriptional regulator